MGSGGGGAEIQEGSGERAVDDAFEGLTCGADAFGGKH